MGSVRVTQGLMVQRILTDLGDQTRRLLALQEQLATGQKVNAPSDNPINARRAIYTRTIIGKNAQYQANITAASPQLQETTTVIGNIENSMERARELTLQASNGTYNQQQRASTAAEINQLLEGVYASANHQVNQRYIFAGSRTLTPAYQGTRDAAGEITAVTFQGNSDPITVAVSDGESVRINESGTTAFQSTQDIFQLLINIRDNLRNNNQANLQNFRIDQLNDARQQLLGADARVGAVQNRLERLTSDLDDFSLQSKQVLSDTIDIDYAEVVMNLNAQSNAYQASLNAASRVLQPSLLDFIQ